ncbi:MAG: hypothetical protein AB7F43_07995 [Bacteriovoracia bacterium]
MSTKHFGFLVLLSSLCLAAEPTFQLTVEKNSTGYNVSTTGRFFSYTTQGRLGRSCVVLDMESYVIRGVPMHLPMGWCHVTENGKIYEYETDGSKIFDIVDGKEIVLDETAESKSRLNSLAFDSYSTNRFAILRVRASESEPANRTVLYDTQTGEKKTLDGDWWPTSDSHDLVQYGDKTSFKTYDLDQFPADVVETFNIPGEHIASFARGNKTGELYVVYNKSQTEQELVFFDQNQQKAESLLTITLNKDAKTSTVYNYNGIIFSWLGDKYLVLKKDYGRTIIIYNRETKQTWEHSFSDVTDTIGLFEDAGKVVFSLLNSFGRDRFILDLTTLELTEQNDDTRWVCSEENEVIIETEPYGRNAVLIDVRTGKRTPLELEGNFYSLEGNSILTVEQRKTDDFIRFYNLQSLKEDSSN